MNNKKKAIIGGILSFILIILGVSVSDNGDSTKEVTDGQIAVGGFTRPNDEADGYTATASQAYLANVTPGSYQSAPTFAFGDGNTGFYENTDNILNVSFAGSSRYYWSGGQFRSMSTGGFRLARDSGSATLPTYTFQGDQDTGMYSDTANTIQFTTGGVDRVAIDSSGYMGIGTTTPYRTLSITDTMNIEPRATAPTGAILGDIYVDSDTNELCFYNGSAWTGIVAAGACS